MITAGKWTIGKNGGSVVTNIPTDRATYTWEDKELEYGWYGGYIVAESIMSDDDARLIAAAPELLHALQCIVDGTADCVADGAPTMIPFHIWLMAKKAVTKAAPDWQMGTPFYFLPRVQQPMPLMIAGAIPDTQHHSYYAR